uniref:Uncharacterized protein n=1 Tax=Arundo donax TaxID=35708 RepID=A0A0A9ASS8_ARUDO
MGPDPKLLMLLSLNHIYGNISMY